MPIGKLLFQLAVPTIAAQVINALYNMVDRIYIGRLPGGEGPLAIAGLGIAFHAKPKVVANAKQSINTIGLDGVLYFLGFKDSYLNM